MHAQRAKELLYKLQPMHSQSWCTYLKEGEDTLS